MKSLKFLPAALCALPGLAAPAQASNQSPAVAAAASQLLALHNAERGNVGVPPLRWDPALAAAAASYGPALERLGRLQHSPRASRPGQRENLWMGTRGAFSPAQMVGSWLAEKREYRPGLFPNVSRSGNWLDVSHYTQMVWRGTTHVGCAIHSSANWDFLICRYSPPGNKDGQAPF